MSVAGKGQLRALSFSNAPANKKQTWSPNSASYLPPAATPSRYKEAHGVLDRGQGRGGNRMRKMEDFDGVDQIIEDQNGEIETVEDKLEKVEREKEQLQEQIDSLMSQKEFIGEMVLPNGRLISYKEGHSIEGRWGEKNRRPVWGFCNYSREDVEKLGGKRGEDPNRKGDSSRKKVWKAKGKETFVEMMTREIQTDLMESD
ncbi:hypothetical protein EV426DRAFT_701806 [Tirmania nivea]|nr:hypothetical protein EV426DRAFT_701806 [Tirmania nivea]